jgi:predicted NUDIX family NTP pyrophosphohydrolase
MKKSGKRVSAGLLMYRFRNAQLEVFIAHPGGPFFQHKDDGHWTIPKGELDEGENHLDAAKREFFEEVGIHPRAPYHELGTIQQKGGKIVHAWAFEGDWAESQVHKCNTFKTEWPPHSGLFKEFKEIDRVCFFTVDEARQKLKPTQAPFLERLQGLLKAH